MVDTLYVCRAAERTDCVDWKEGKKASKKEWQHIRQFPHTHSHTCTCTHPVCNLMCIYSSLSGLDATLNEGKRRGVITQYYSQPSPSLPGTTATNLWRFYSERAKR